MTTADGPRPHPAAGEEVATAAKGTPAPVDVAVDPRSRNALTVLLAGPVIGVLHFAVVYLVGEAGCTGDGPGLDPFDPPVPTVVTVVATVVAALASAAVAVLAHRRWRRGRLEDEEVLVDREPLAFVSLLLALMALVTVLLVGAPALVLRAC